mgnify:CR=1 FL=1
MLKAGLNSRPSVQGVATRHALIDGDAIVVLGKVLNSHECTNDGEKNIK